MAQLSVERRGAVAVCTITNPPMGYMDSATVTELDALTGELEADQSVRAVVFTGGVPGIFVRHYSVEELEGLSVRLRQAGVKVLRSMRDWRCNGRASSTCSSPAMLWRSYTG